MSKEPLPSQRYPVKEQKMVDSAFSEWDKAAMSNEFQPTAKRHFDRVTGVKTTRGAGLPETLSGLLLSLPLIPSTNGEH